MTLGLLGILHLQGEGRLLLSTRVGCGWRLDRTSTTLKPPQTSRFRMDSLQGSTKNLGHSISTWISQKEQKPLQGSSPMDRSYSSALNAMYVGSPGMTLPTSPSPKLSTRRSESSIKRSGRVYSSKALPQE